MAHDRLLNLHPLFKGETPVQTALEGHLRELEKTGLSDAEHTQLATHFDALAESPTLDGPALDEWLQEFDTFIAVDFKLDSVEWRKIRSINSLVGTATFDRNRFLDALSPYQIDLDPSDQARIEKYMRLQWKNPKIPLPSALPSSQSEILEEEYQQGMEMLDDYLATFTSQYGQPKPHTLTVEDVLDAKKRLYRETLARLINPARYEKSSLETLMLAAQNGSREARLHVIARYHRYVAAHFQEKGTPVPLKKIDAESETFFKRTDEILTYFEFDVYGSAGRRDAKNKNFTSPLIDFNACLAEARTGLPDRLNFLDPQFIPQFKQKMRDYLQKATLIENIRFHLNHPKVPSEEPIQSLKLAENLQILANQFQKKKAFEFRIAVEGTLGGTDSYNRFSDLSFQFARTAQQIFKSSGWEKEYAQYLQTRFLTLDFAEQKAACEVLLRPAGEYVEVRLDVRKNHFEMEIGKLKIRSEITTKLTWKQEPNGDFHLTLPRLDPIKDEKKLKNFLARQKSLAAFPTAYANTIVDYCLYYLREKPMEGTGVGGGIFVASPKANNTSVALQALLTSTFQGLDASNLYQRVETAYLLLSMANQLSDKRPSQNQATAFFTPVLLGTIRPICEAWVRQISGENSPEYARYAQFMVLWANLTNGLPPAAKRLAIEPFFNRFPAPLLTAQNAYRVGEMLAILKATSGDLYGRYIDSLTEKFEETHLKPVTGTELVRATRTLQGLFRWCGNMYRGTNFPAFAKVPAYSDPFEGAEENAEFISPMGKVRVSAKDGRNVFDDLFETLRESVAQSAFEIAHSYRLRAQFATGLSPLEIQRAQILFEQYGTTLTLDLKPESGWTDDINDLSDHWNEDDGILNFAGRLLNRVEVKASNKIGEDGPYRREMFEGQVAPPVLVENLRDGAGRYEIALKDGKRLGVMYVFDLKTGKFQAEMMGRGKENLTTEYVSAQRPQMILESQGVFWDSSGNIPAYAMGTTDGKKKTLHNSFFSQQVDGVLIISNHFRDIKIMGRGEVAKGFAQKQAFFADFNSGKIDNFAQAQLLIHKGKNEYEGKPLVYPVYTYQDQKSLVCIDAQGRLVVILLSERVTFYETTVILEQLGIQEALNMDINGGLLDHHVDLNGDHQHDGTGINPIAKFVVW